MGSKNPPLPVVFPPVAIVAPLATASWTWLLHDLDLLLGDQRADIHRVRTVVDALPDRPHPLGEQCDKPVVGRCLDVHPLHRDAGLTRVEQCRPRDAVGGARKIGVGQDDGRVLAAQFDAAGNQSFARPRGDGPSGPGGTGELHHVHGVHHCCARRAETGDTRENRWCTDLFPAAGEFPRGQRSDLRGLHEDGRAGQQCRDGIDTGNE